MRLVKINQMFLNPAHIVCIRRDDNPDYTLIVLSNAPTIRLKMSDTDFSAIIARINAAMDME